MQIVANIELPEREAAFVSGLVCGMKPCPAAQAAGYSPAHTRALLARGRVRAALIAIAGNARAALAEAEFQP